MVKVASDWKTGCISRDFRTSGNHKVLVERSNVQQLRAPDSGAMAWV